MFNMLALFAGGRQALAEKPQTVFDVCPSPPLIWSDFGAENLIELARARVPAQLISMPLAGATAPVTLLGSVVQHAAKPHETVDPFNIFAHVILALNAIPSRRISAFEPAVVSVGSIHGGHTQNVIPDRVEMTGTLRYTETKVQEKIHNEIQRAFELSRALGGDYTLRYEIGMPPMQNHPEAVKLIQGAAGRLLG